jgi:hypothetical protein
VLPLSAIFRKRVFILLSHFRDQPRKSKSVFCVLPLSSDRGWQNSIYLYTELIYIPFYCQNICWMRHHFFLFRKHGHCTYSLAKELHLPSNKSQLSVEPTGQCISRCDEIPPILTPRHRFPVSSDRQAKITWACRSSQKEWLKVWYQNWSKMWLMEKIMLIFKYCYWKNLN